MDKLEETILEHRGKKFLVIEPGGHNGDRLIYMGMENKLKQLGIKYTVYQYRENPRVTLLHRIYFGPWKRILRILSVVYKLENGVEMAINRLDNRVYEEFTRTDRIQVDQSHVILIHGGGNINDLYGFGIRLLKNAIKHSPDSVIIVGPQSYWFKWTCFEKLFQATEQEIHLFCREKYSYNLLKSINLPKNVHVNLSHDAAFYLSKENFHAHGGSYYLMCFRTDRESAVFQKTQGNLLQKIGTKDLRKSKERVIVGDISLHPNFRHFVDLIEGSRMVYTDRLHVAILAALLGKPTTLLSTSYYKSKGVYEYSLFKYPNVKFVDISKHCKVKEIEMNLEFLLMGAREI